MKLYYINTHEEKGHW